MHEHRPQHLRKVTARMKMVRQQAKKTLNQAEKGKKTLNQAEKHEIEWLQMAVHAQFGPTYPRPTHLYEQWKN